MAGTGMTENLIAKYLLGTLAICLSLMQLYYGFTSVSPATYLRPIHLGWMMVLAIMVYPLYKSFEASAPILKWPSVLFDMALMGAVCWASFRIISFDYNSIDYLLNGLGSLDTAAGMILCFALLEITRRSVGVVMTLITGAFLAYSFFGHMLPGVMSIKDFGLQEIIRFQVFSNNGIFGAPLGIAATTVFVFVLFGAFLEVTGAGKFFIDMAFAIAGKSKGGPAKASVIASAAFGSISGSAIANTVTTGALTIPMMKKLGYKKEQAGGIEAAASTGGQIMPPVMGAGAFVMAQFTGIPYAEIMVAAIVPAILYFSCTLLCVHIMACKLDLPIMGRKESVKRIFINGMHFLLPLIFITTLLVMAFSPLLVGTAGCIAILLSSWLRKNTRIGFRKILEGLRAGAILAIPISVACASAGIIVGVVGQTGFGLYFTQVVADLSQGYLWAALLLTALTALILGMGLPVTASYIVLAVISVPMLQDLGLNLLVAHMIVLWLSQTSNITPPIALAAFAAAGVAHARPIPTSVEAFKLGAGFFIIPFMMAHTDLMFEQDIMSFGIAIILTIATIISIVSLAERYFLQKTSALQLAITAGALPFLLNGGYIALVGCALVIVFLILQFAAVKQVRV